MLVLIDHLTRHTSFADWLCNIQHLVMKRRIQYSLIVALMTWQQPHLS